MKVAIVGGGITGLAAAHRLNELDPTVDVHLFESSDRLGGVLRTERSGDFLLEHSADMFTTKDTAAIELCKRIGFEDELIQTNGKFQRAFIVKGNSLVPVPKGLNLMSPSNLDAIRETTLLSSAGKKRFLDEVNVPPKLENQDDSLFEFATRRFGAEAYDKIIQPLVGGIYTADPKKLSMQATLNQYLDMERRHGSVIGAMARQKKVGENDSLKSDAVVTSGARYNLFLAPRNGMAAWIAALQSRLTNTTIQLNSFVRSISSEGASWRLQSSSGESEFDRVLISTPASIAAKLLCDVDLELSRQLQTICYASSAIVVHGFSRESVEDSLEGFGFVVPLSESRNILAASFSSVKYAGRSPDESVLIRSFVGGACQPELLEQTDASICDMVKEDLADLLGVKGAPQLESVVRWTESMPQYHVGHTDLVAQIESSVASINHLAIAGKSYKGVGIPACVQSGESAAESLLDSAR
jgi:oxygen-dependent protoporphyrinogen oxidase